MINNSVTRKATEVSGLDRVRIFNASLDKLMSLYTNNSSSVEEFVEIVTEETSRLLHVHRVSIWSFFDNRKSVLCLDLFESISRKHSNGATLSAEDFPDYFQAVLDARVIDASEAAVDPRTREFQDSYLAPNDILSMLDAQVRSAAGPRGVVCAESVGIQRNWTPDEIAFVVSIAELVGFAMDRRDREQVHTELEETNQKLETAVQREKDISERYDLALGAAFDGIWDWDLRSGDVYFTKQNSILLGENPSKLNQTTDKLSWWKDRVHGDDAPAVEEAIKEHLETGTTYDQTYRIRHSDGSWRWWRSRGEVQRDESQVPIRFVGTNSDVTSLVKARQELERKNCDLVTAKKKIEAISLEDPLTKLPNRRCMERFAETLLQQATSENREIAFLHIDLDKFKEINDRFGHSAGDYVLRKIAATLSETIGAGQFVARTGGDEFVAILTNQKSREDVVQLAEKLIGQLNLPMLYQNQHCLVGASVGISFVDDSNCTASQLLDNADIALYGAKRAGRNRVKTFSSEMGLEADARRKLHGEILEGLEKGEFVPYFQPQFCASSLELAGVEALVRWNHPVRGVLGPYAFLDAAEELGKVAEIDRLVLEKSVAIVEEWERGGFFVPRLSVNVSSSRLNDPDLVETVESLNLQRNFLAFELLESTFLDETSQQVEQNLARLNDLGVKIEIDDFGTGYASLAGLLNIRPHRLKIDRQLIMDIEEDETVFELVKSVVVIADCMNIEVLAEGVETERQIELLCEAGCQFLQGFKLGRPVSADDIYKRFCGSIVEPKKIRSLRN
ncbi:EAL domain-containing protein [Mariniblastus sp.]|nr:EAL domain-containing protein [Mariniblastus sp.]